MNVVIIGGGVAGLSATYNLCKRGFKPIVLEKNQSMGGLLESFKIRDYYIEKFYHHIFKQNNEFLNLLKELDIHNKLSWIKTTSGFINRSGLYELTSPFDILSFKPLNFFEKIKLVSLLLKMKTINNLEKYDNITAKEWIINNSDKGVYEKFFKPLLKAKYGSFIETVSAAWFISRIKTRSERSLSGENLGYLNGGFDVFIEKLANRISQMGGKLLTNSDVRAINIKNNNVEEIRFIKDGKTKKIKPEYVISTLPIPILLELCNGLPKEYKLNLEKIKYQGSICVLLGLKRNLSNIYWLNVMDEAPFGAVIEHTNFQQARKYGGDKIVYLASYAESKSNLFNKSNNKKIASEFMEHLKKLFNIDEKDIKWVRLAKEKYTSSIYNVGYLKIKPSFRTPIKNMFIAGLPLAYPERSINDSVRSGIDVSNLVGR